MEVLAVFAASMTDVVNQHVCDRSLGLLALANDACGKVSNPNKLSACRRRIVKKV
jgi:hypothetical protein